MKNVLVTAADYPDLDGVACAIAYINFKIQTDSRHNYIAKFGKGLQIEPEFIVKELSLTAELLSSHDRYDLFVLVDACEPKGLPSLVRNHDVIDVIDHRLYPDYPAFPNAEFRIEPVGAAATQIAEFFYFNQDIELKPEIASLLQCAIYSNTINFQSENTTFRDERMRDWLNTKIKKEYKDLPQRMFRYKTDYALENLEEAMRLDVHDDNLFDANMNIVIYQLEVISSTAFLQQSNEIFELMHQIYPYRQHQFLIIQDLGKGNTFILVENNEVREVLQKTSLQLEVANENTLYLNKIVMRKGIKKALKEYFQVK